jgi:hypothetical protein
MLNWPSLKICGTSIGTALGCHRIPDRSELIQRNFSDLRNKQVLCHYRLSLLIRFKKEEYSIDVCYYTRQRHFGKMWSDSSSMANLQAKSRRAAPSPPTDDPAGLFSFYRRLFPAAPVPCRRRARPPSRQKHFR